jgi:signal transduction histidine kinase
MLQQSVLAMVDQQKVQLRAAAETEMKFIAFLSHDLGNNMLGLDLVLRGLRNDLAGAPKEAEAMGELDVATKAIRDTMAGMKRLLEHERMRKSAPKVELKPVGLRALATNLVRQYSRAAERKGLRFAIEAAPDAIAQSDEALLGLVLQNLVGNAVKFSDKGTIRIGAGRETQAGGRWVLWVADQGPGIEPERRKAIFEAFERGQTHGQTGMGLGLAIASQAADLLGCGLDLESELGVGTTFRLRLPEEAK